MLQEFKKFLMRGNVVDLAVAVVIGVAFGAVVTSFVDNVISPIIGLVGGDNFNNLAITLKDADPAEGKEAVKLGYGAVITALIDFVLVAAAIFFLVVKPINVLQERRNRGEEAEVPPSQEELLTEIRDLLAARQP